jgi:KaiC/GvpD/RAD55 family RecA-like ATPase
LASQASSSPSRSVSFEERPQDISENVASLGYDLPRLIAEKKLVIDQVIIERGENEESGSFDLEGLFGASSRRSSAIMFACPIIALNALSCKAFPRKF